MRPLLAVLLIGGCTGSIGLPAVPRPGQPVVQRPQSPDPRASAAQVELRRLTPHELDLTLEQLVGDARHLPSTLLPGEQPDPFDNDYSRQLPSAVWLEGAEQVADQTVAFALADPARVDALMGCHLESPTDRRCLEHFIRGFGRRALRRPLDASEVTEFERTVGLAASEGDATAAVGAVMKQLLLDPAFLFRVEHGTPVERRPGVFRLSQYELASRLSFFLQGRAPPDWLLDLAGSGNLSSPAEVRVAAERLLRTPEGRAQVEAFHAQWLGYAYLPDDPQLAQALTTETNALVDRVVFDAPLDYHELFLSTQTYLDATLARHYGMAAPADGGFGWVEYDNPARRGVLSHGAVLGNGIKGGDTSPVLRGKWVRNRLLCTTIGPPPPDARPTLPPATPDGPCKSARYAAHAQGSCAGCHRQMDPVGFGLEQFDGTGGFRLTEVAHPECAISGAGDLDGVSFEGPAGLAQLLVDSGRLDHCVVQQVFSFASGRAPLAADAETLDSLYRQFQAGGRRFDALLLDLVSSPAFAERKEAE